MKRSSGPRKTASLSESIHQQLNMYAIAAGAAGVSMLALAQPAEARIVYSPAHVQLKDTADVYALDLAHNGRKDFFLVVNFNEAFPSGLQSLQVCHHHPSFTFNGSYRCLGSQSSATNAMNQVVANKPNGPAAALRAGAKIQNGDPFAGFPGHPVGVSMGGDAWEGTNTTNLRTQWFGPWMNGGRGVTNRYLGLKFKINGKFHFGWARLTVTTTHKDFGVFTTILTGYAYETIVGKSIIAGQTKGADDVGVEESRNLPTPQYATLGALAMGAPGLSIWRRKESVHIGD